MDTIDALRQKVVEGGATRADARNRLPCERGVLQLFFGGGSGLATCGGCAARGGSARRVPHVCGCKVAQRAGSPREARSRAGAALARACLLRSAAAAAPPRQVQRTTARPLAQEGCDSAPRQHVGARAYRAGQERARQRAYIEHGVSA